VEEELGRGGGEGPEGAGKKGRTRPGVVPGGPAELPEVVAHLARVAFCHPAKDAPVEVVVAP
jgi:hypothetical protein